MSLLSVRSLSVLFPTSPGPARVVEDVSYDHSRGENLALVGETGCGKSVLSLALLNLLPQNAVVEGSILYEGRNLLGLENIEWASIRARRISLVPQNASLSLNPVHSIGRQIGELYRIHLGMPTRAISGEVRILLDRMGFADPDTLMTLYPHQLSEGMSQRVLIAAGIALEPELIIADEPTKMLDDRLKEKILQEMEGIKELSSTDMLIITHDLDAAERLSDRILVMYAGQIVEEAGTGDFFESPLHPYSKGLIASLPKHGFIPIPGQSPSMISPPEGCRFHPRCPISQDICRKDTPGLEVKQGRKVRCFLV